MASLNVHFNAVCTNHTHTHSVCVWILIFGVRAPACALLIYWLAAACWLCFNLIIIMCKWCAWTHTHNVSNRILCMLCSSSVCVCVCPRAHIMMLNILGTFVKVFQFTFQIALWSKSFWIYKHTHTRAHTLEVRTAGCVQSVRRVQRNSFAT